VARAIVGLGGLLSDPGVCVIKDGQIVSAIEQAKILRFDRLGAFPEEAVALAMQTAGLGAEAVECVAIATPFSQGSESTAQLRLRARFPKSRAIIVEHHHAHAASAYYASDFQSARVLSIDRSGDFRSAVLFQGEGSRLTPVRELYFPDSIGDLFNRVTELLGFEPRADEHKVQWLSTFGTPLRAQIFRDLLHRDGSEWPQIDRAFLDADRLNNGGFSARFYEALGVKPGESLDIERKAEIAASLQTAVNEAVTVMIGAADRVCIAGGLALNALLIRSLEERYQNVFVQPAAGNAGTAIGAALYAWHNWFREETRIPFSTLCLGPAFPPTEIKQVVENCKLRFRFLRTEGELIEEAVRQLNDHKIVAWMQGRMEFGPRALGNRSILASPLNPYSTENLNIYIKHREAFRKFAASVPEEAADQYFEVGPNARYLATVGRLKQEYKETFAAAKLGDDLIRVHTVRKNENPLFYALLSAAGAATGLPVLYNTSFNLFGDPLVCTARDAVRSFYSSGIDTLFAGSFLLEK
jgi:carbamoyltransferase